MAVAAPVPFHQEVRSYGLDALAAGSLWSREEAAAWAPVLRAPERRWRWEDLFWHRLDGARLVAADVLSLARSWRPALVLRDCTEFGGSWAADLLGIPHVAVGASGGIGTLSIRAEYGGSVVEFANCSWSPPGNAIWQP